MATGYTQDQLMEMVRLLFECIPRAPDENDAMNAPVPPSISTATIPTTGVLVNFGADEKGKDRVMFLTPIVAKHLVQEILLAAKEHGWWDEDGNFIPKPS